MRVNGIEKSFMANNYYNRKNLSYTKDKNENKDKNNTEDDLKFENMMKIKLESKFQI